jgi:hypothetical protein
VPCRPRRAAASWRVSALGATQDGRSHNPGQRDMALIKPRYKTQAGGLI